MRDAECRYCHVAGHIVAACPQLRCRRCGAQGHREAACPAGAATPAGGPARSGGAQAPAASAAAVAAAATVPAATAAAVAAATGAGGADRATDAAAAPAARRRQRRRRRRADKDGAKADDAAAADGAGFDAAAAVAASAPSGTPAAPPKGVVGAKGGAKDGGGGTEKKKKKKQSAGAEAAAQADGKAPPLRASDDEAVLRREAERLTRLAEKAARRAKGGGAADASGASPSQGGAPAPSADAASGAASAAAAVASPAAAARSPRPRIRPWSVRATERVRATAYAQALQDEPTTNTDAKVPKWLRLTGLQQGDVLRRGARLAAEAVAALPARPPPLPPSLDLRPLTADAEGHARLATFCREATALLRDHTAHAWRIFDDGMRAVAGSYVAAFVAHAAAANVSLHPCGVSGCDEAFATAADLAVHTATRHGAGSGLPNIGRSCALSAAMAVMAPFRQALCGVPCPQAEVELRRLCEAAWALPSLRNATELWRKLPKALTEGAHLPQLDGVLGALAPALPGMLAAITTSASCTSAACGAPPPAQTVDAFVPTVFAQPFVDFVHLRPLEDRARGRCGACSEPLTPAASLALSPSGMAWLLPVRQHTGTDGLHARSSLAALSGEHVLPSTSLRVLVVGVVEHTMVGKQKKQDHFVAHVRSVDGGWHAFDDAKAPTPSPLRTELVLAGVLLMRVSPEASARWVASTRPPSTRTLPPAVPPSSPGGGAPAGSSTTAPAASAPTPADRAAGAAGGADAALRDHLAQLDAVRGELEEVRRQVGAYRQLHREGSTQLEELGSRQRVAQDEVAALQGRHAQLQRETEEAVALRDAAVADVQAKRDAQHSLQAEMLRLQGSHDDLVGAIACLSMHHQDAQRNCAARRKELTAMEGALERVRAEKHAASKALLEQREQEATTRNAQFVRSSSELRALQEQAAETAASVQRNEARIRLLAADEAATEVRIAKLREIQQRSEEEVAATEARKCQKQGEVADLERDIAEQGARIQEATMEVARLREQRAGLQQRCNDASREVATLGAEVAGLRTRRDALAADTHAADLRRIDVQGAAAAATAELGVVQDRLRQEREQSVATAQALSEGQAQLSQLREAQRTLEVQHHETAAQGAAVTAQIGATIANLRDAAAGEAHRAQAAQQERMHQEQALEAVRAQGVVAVAQATGALERLHAQLDAAWASLRNVDTQLQLQASTPAQLFAAWTRAAEQTRALRVRYEVRLPADLIALYTTLVERSAAFNERPAANLLPELSAMAVAVLKCRSESAECRQYPQDLQHAMDQELHFVVLTLVARGELQLLQEPDCGWPPHTMLRDLQIRLNAANLGLLGASLVSAFSAHLKATTPRDASPPPHHHDVEELQSRAASPHPARPALTAPEEHAGALVPGFRGGDL